MLFNNQLSLRVGHYSWPALLCRGHKQHCKKYCQHPAWRSVNTLNMRSRAATQNLVSLLATVNVCQQAAHCCPTAPDSGDAQACQSRMQAYCVLQVSDCDKRLFAFDSHDSPVSNVLHMHAILSRNELNHGMLCAALGIKTIPTSARHVASL
jgi:hypothetical protein